MPRQARRKTTLKDVANAVGVHVSTVSRALDERTRHMITAEVRERIVKVSRELNYSPNAAAYSLRTNRTRLIGVLIPDITNPIFPPIIRGIDAAATGRKQNAATGTQENDVEGCRERCWRACLDRFAGA